METERRPPEPRPPDPRPRVGFTCSYAPLALVHAAGLVPYRVLPMGDAPDRAGALLHDNLCPEVKRVLDRRLAGDLPALEGMVIVNSCDAMRRLANAWTELEGPDRVLLLDLPVFRGGRATDYLQSRLAEAHGRFVAWSGVQATEERLRASVQLYDELHDLMAELGRRLADGTLAGGRGTYQRWANRSVTEPPEAVAAELRSALAAPATIPGARGVPLVTFGNVMPDPAAAELLEACGARVVDDDLCTGARQLTRVGLDGDRPALRQIATALAKRPLCARTMDPSDPGALARQAIALARRTGARGAVMHVAKFCDPFLLRIPAIREAFRQAEVPLLTLEGDCTLRSLGQQQTRIEAFVEMLQEGAR